MKKFFIRTSILLAILFTGYFIWSLTGRATEKESGWSKNPEFKVRFEYIEQGADSGKGNIIGIQPYLTAVNYSTAYNLETSLRFYFEQLKREGKLNSKSVVVLPQHIGTWLFAANEKEKVYKAASAEDAMKAIMSASIFSYLYSYFQSPVSNKNNYAVFHLKAAKMAAHYQQLFSTLANEYKCRIAAGSIILPDAFVDADNTLQVKKGAALYNTFMLFDTTGIILQPPTKTELSNSILPELSVAENFVTATSSKHFPNISYEKWEEATKLLKTDSAHSYKTASPAALKKNQQGISLSFNGDLWNRQFKGRLHLLQNDSLTVLPPAIGKGRIVCLWLKN
nr:hypothetical protein [uncultured Lacibacter sp.]